MDLSKVNNEEKLNICRKYFYGGFALLPVLWLVNFIWFFRDAFLKDSFPEQKKIRQFVIISGILGFFGIGVVVAWAIVYQKYRLDWGEAGDRLLFVIPVGKP